MTQPYDPTTGQGEIDPRLLRRRDPSIVPSDNGAGVNRPAPRGAADESRGDGGMTYDAGQIYQPRYQEERPNNFGTALQSATRQGSLLNIIGALTGGGNYQQAHNYNEGEHRKFTDSLAMHRMAIEEKLANRPQNDYKTWQDRIMDRTDLSDEQKSEMIHGKREPKAEHRKNVEDILLDPASTDEDRKRAKDTESVLHPVKPEKPEKGSFSPVDWDDDGDGIPDRVRSYDNHAGKFSDPDAGGRPARVSTPRKPKAEFDPKSKEVDLIGVLTKQYIDSHSGRYPDQEATANIGRQAKQQVAMQSRAAGIMPDQRKPAGGVQSGVPSAPSAPPPQLKPNYRYRIGGKEVHTDAKGNLIQ
jgi:hypothetical protein